MTRKQKTSCSSAYDTALKFLSPKARTVREVEMKLDEGDYSEGEIIQTVERLTEAGLLNDEKYAMDFIESRLNTKPVSRFRLREQLKAHYVPNDIIESALGSLSDDSELENAVKVAAKFRDQFEGIDDKTKKRQRIYLRLQTRGYSHDTIMRAMDIVFDE